MDTSDSYNKFTDEARRRSRRARQQQHQQLLEQQHYQHQKQMAPPTRARHAPYDAYYTSSPICDDEDEYSDDEDADKHVFDAAFVALPTSRHMRAQSSSTTCSTTSSIAFPANTNSSRRASSSSPYSSAPSSPYWSSFAQQSSYSPPPESPYTTPYTLFEDEHESATYGKTDSTPSARRGGALALNTGNASKRDATSKRPSSAEQLSRVDSLPQSLHSLDGTAPRSSDRASSPESYVFCDDPTSLDSKC
jgi:hypothetical protein